MTPELMLTIWIDEDLLSRRRLGKTKLQVKPGQVGTSNATKPENLGTFEYAHLRAPLPKDLKGSEIFASHQNQPHPETYFLMVRDSQQSRSTRLTPEQRRSKDGYVSATGMFKIAFPWALHAEEKAERDYLKSKDNTSQDEIAGNVWISPELGVLRNSQSPSPTSIDSVLFQPSKSPKSMACTSG